MKKWVEVLATDPSPQSATAILFPSGWEGRKRKGKKKEKQREKEIEWEESEEEQIIINLPGSLQWQYRNRPPFLRYYHSLPLSAFCYLFLLSFIFLFLSFNYLPLISPEWKGEKKLKKKKSLARKKKRVPKKNYGPTRRSTVLSDPTRCSNLRFFLLPKSLFFACPSENLLGRLICSSLSFFSGSSRTIFPPSWF